MFASLRKAFFSGVVLLAPIGITFFVFNWMVARIGGSFRDKLLFFIPVSLRDNQQLLWNTVATIAVLLAITGLGFLSRYFIAKYMLSIAERFLNNVPIINTVYTSVKQIVDTFSSQNRNVFQKVVMIQFPRPGAYAIGFTTGKTKGEAQKTTKEKLTNVFVPTTPNPTSGFLVMLPDTEITYMDMTVGEGMKFIVSGGAVVPARQELEAADSGQ